MAEKVSQNVRKNRALSKLDSLIRQEMIHTFRDGQCWAPLVPQNVQADRAVRVDVRVVDLGREADLGRLEGVVRGEGDREEEYAAGVRRVTLEGQYR